MPVQIPPQAAGILDKEIQPGALLGWLQLSEGRPSEKFRKELARAWSLLASAGIPQASKTLLDWLETKLRAGAAAGGGAGIFVGPPLAHAALDGARVIIEATRISRRELLGHLTPNDLAGPFWLIALLELLASRLAADSQHLQPGTKGILPTTGLEILAPLFKSVLVEFHDFVGYRPVPVLESGRKVRIHSAERHRPAPLWWPGMGVAPIESGPLIARAVHWLGNAPPEILEEAGFNLSTLGELALDLREFDHSLPAAQRPNHLFGEWDAEKVDLRGHWNRMVVRSTLVRLLWEHVNHPGPGDPTDFGERLEEAGILLAGTILMSSGVLGWGPGATDPTKTLGLVVPRIARLRDGFYQQVMLKLPPAHRARLEGEARLLKQPFGRVRQALNRAVAVQRATQLQDRQLARLFARLGLEDLARERTGKLPVPSLRLAVHFDRLMARQKLRTLKGRKSRLILGRCLNLLKRGIRCGAFADPWNLIGFQGLYPISPAREDAVPDPRLEDLLSMVASLFREVSRAYAFASADSDRESQRLLRELLAELTEWWGKYPAKGDMDLDHPDAWSEQRSALRVARAIRIWRKRGEIPADLPFWKKVLSTLETGESVAEIFDVLVGHDDLLGALGIMIYWMDAFDLHSTAEGRSDLPRMAKRWFGAWQAKSERLQSGGEKPPEGSEKPSPAGGRPQEKSPAEALDAHRKLLVRAIELVEANMPDDPPGLIRDHLVPSEPGAKADESGEEPWSEREDEEESDEEEDREPEPWNRDDEHGGVDDGQPGSDFSLETALFGFDHHVSQFESWIWILENAAITPGLESFLCDHKSNLAVRSRQFRELMNLIHESPVPKPGGEISSVTEFERRRVMKTRALEQVGELVFRTEALLYSDRFEQAALKTGESLPKGSAPKGIETGPGAKTTPAKKSPPEDTHETEADDPADSSGGRELSLGFARGFATGSAKDREAWSKLLLSRELLFQPISMGGNPEHWLKARMNLWFVQRTLVRLAREGDFSGLIRFLEKAHRSEVTSKLPPPRVSEFHHYFEIAFVESFRTVFGSVSRAKAREIRSAGLFRGLMTLMEKFREIWLTHGRQTRLSILDTVDDRSMENLRGFIRHFGRDLFPSRLMTLGNLRGILDQGVGPYLRNLERERDPLEKNLLLDELDGPISITDASSRLETVIRAIVENYEAYKDYKTTTTVSDYGENLHILLDFLRLKASFIREVWNRQPWYLLHREMLDAGLRHALDEWLKEVMAELQPLAQKYTAQLDALEQRHGVRILTIRQEIEEGLWLPMETESLVFRLRDLCHLLGGNDPDGFARELGNFKGDLEKWVSRPWGVGRDVPDWIRNLEEKSKPREESGDGGLLGPQFAEVKVVGDLTLKTIKEKLEALGREK